MYSTLMKGAWSLSEVIQLFYAFIVVRTFIISKLCAINEEFLKWFNDDIINQSMAYDKDSAREDKNEQEKQNRHIYNWNWI